jgi:Prohead core protein serine protease
MTLQTNPSTSRRLICEGWLEEAVNADALTQEAAASLVIPPDVVYVQQGSKALFFKGKPQQLHESIGSDVQIVESIDQLETITDSEGKSHIKDGKWVVEGVFQRSGVKNANGRTYSRKLWERVLNDKSEAFKALKDRAMIGHLEHPANGRTDGNLGSMLILSAKLMEDGTVYGTAKILDTPPGKTLKVYCMEGVRWGFSSRGSGIIRPDGVVDENDYKLETWDAVMRPSTPGAYAQKPGESAKPKESEEKPKEEPVVQESAEEKQLTEQIDVMVGECEKVEEADLSLIQRFMKHFGAATALTAKIPPKRASAIQSKLKTCADLLNSKFPEAATITEEVGRTLDEVVEEENTAAIREAAFERVVAKFTKQLQEAKHREALVSSQLSEMTLKCESASQRVSELEEQRGAMQDRADALEADLRESQSQLEVARQFIAESTSTEISDPVKDRIRAIIKENPEFEQYRDILENANSPERVDMLAEQLVEVVRPPAERTPPAEINDRPALPKGNVVSESTVRTRTATTSQGAMLAAKAMHRSRR